MFAAINPAPVEGNYFIEDRFILYRAFASQPPSASSQYGTIAAGIQISAGRGYRVRLGPRANFFRLPRPGGPSQPELWGYWLGSVARHLLSFHFGIDLVLQAKPGRRY